MPTVRDMLKAAPESTKGTTIRQMIAASQQLDKAIRSELRGWYVLGVPEKKPWIVIEGSPFSSKAEAEKVRAKVDGSSDFKYGLVSEYDRFQWTSNPNLSDALTRYLHNLNEKGETMASIKSKRSRAKTKPRTPKGKPRLCACGCGEMTSGVEFIRGHHTILRSKLVKAIRKARVKGDVAKEEKATGNLIARGWERFIPPKEKSAARKTNGKPGRPRKVEPVAAKPSKPKTRSKSVKPKASKARKASAKPAPVRKKVAASRKPAKRAKSRTRR